MSNLKPPFNRVVKTIILALVGLLFVCLKPISSEPYGNGNINNGGGGVGIHIGSGVNLGLSDLLKCPKVCTCTGQTVDCSHRGLTQVPRRIPLDTERL